MVETRSQRKQQNQKQYESEGTGTTRQRRTTNGANASSDPSSSSPSKETTTAQSSSQPSSTIKDKPSNINSNTKLYVIISTIIIVIISIVTLPKPFQPPPGTKPSVLHVWYYGWITALSTGLGVLPLVFTPDLDKYYIGISNAVAAGMMIAASYQLIVEGYTFDDEHDHTEVSAPMRTGIGCAVGLVFILITKKFLEQHEDEYNVGDLMGADARRALLIFFVMLLHSFSEGVGIGVSFGGSNGHELGVYISASLAVHNIPEGLAIAVVLLPSHMGDYAKLTAALWAIVTSIPQPIMAVPAYLFVDYFVPILPVGLGFAGGAMAWVALFELLFEAYEDTKSLLTTSIVSTIALLTMLFVTGTLDDR